MTNRKCNNWIKTYMRYSAHSEAPDAFHFWTAISVLAGALRRRVWIDQGYFQWTPNFYIVFVAPPGIVSKTTTANIGMNLLRRVPGVAFGPDAVTWQSLVQSLAASKSTFMYQKKPHIMSTITIVSGEFGTFMNPSDREMVDVMVSLWDGQKGDWGKSTKTQGSDTITNPWINLLACTTPAWIAGNFPEYMIGGGFASRTIFVYAEKKRQLIAYPKKSMPEDFIALGDDLVHDLKHIATKLIGEYEIPADTTALGEEWYANHNKELSSTMTNDRFHSYLARKQTHIHKLSIVLAAAESDELIIKPEHLTAAIAITTSLEEEMPKIFANIGAAGVKSANEVVELVLAHGQLPVKTAYRMIGFHKMSWKDFEQAVQSGVQAGLIKAEKRGMEIMLRSTKGAANG